MTDGGIVAGIDEVGRGALAGPVVACACVLTLPLTKLRMTPPRWRPYKVRGSCVRIADSKLLSPESREKAYRWLTTGAFFGIGMASVEEINTMGIVGSTNVAMNRALETLLLSVTPDLLLVDGRDAFQFALPHRSIIRGDQLEPAIAAASIIAKVTRDRLLQESESLFPGFSFGVHKGYGTPRHLAELKKNGATTFHRSLFIRSALLSVSGGES